MEVYLKVTIAMFYFYHLKNSSNIMENVLSPSRKKISLSLNIRNKYVKRKVNLLFRRHEKCPNFSLEIGHFEHGHSFFFSREMWNIRSYKEVRLQKFIKFRLSG